MSFLSDGLVERLKDVTDAPDLSATSYEPLRRIGRGGMAVVWQARDRSLDRDVAVKVEAFADAGGRMEREARVLARLEHPGIPPVHDVGRLPDGRFWCAMQLIRGATFESVAASMDRFERLRVLLRVCDAIAYAHAHGIIHRDLKPSNIMLGAFGEVLVMDWGVAVVGEGMRAGTPGWMAPEQETGGAVDARTDVHGLGGLLRFALEVSSDPVPKPLRAIRDCALSPDPSLRYPSAEDFAADLRRFLDGRPVSAYRESVFERLGRLVSFYRVPILLVLTYLLLRVALLLVQP